MGYHGTNKSCVERIKTQGFNFNNYSFIVSRNQKIPGDLGSGAYFFENSIENAYKFALKQNCNPLEVLECTIEVEDEFVLDMDDPENQEYFRIIRDDEKTMKSLSNRFVADVGGKGRGNLDGLILEFLIHNHKLKVNLIKKRTYTPFDGMPRTSNYPNGTELCVRNKGIIKSVKTVDTIYQEG